MCPDRGDIDPGESSLGGTGGKEERASRTGQDHEAGPSRLQGADGGSVQGHRADVRQHHSFRHYNEAGPSTHRPMAASSSSSSPPSRSAPPPYSPAPITSHASRQHADTANTSDRAYTDRTLDRTGAAFAAGGEQVKQGQISSGHGQIGQVGQEGHEDRGDRFVSANPSNTVHHSFEFASASTSSPTQMPTARSGHAPESSDASFSSLSGSTYSSGRSTMASTPTATRPSIPRVRSGSGSGSTSTSDRNSTSSSTTTPSTTSTAYFAPSTRSSMSTAFSPTFPSSVSGTQRAPRAWVPTTNVPEHISRRHRKQDGGSRWLSEDEGIGGSGLARRRGSAGTSGSRGGGGGGGGVGPSASASGSGFGTGLGIGIGAGVGMSGQGAAGGYGDRPRRAPAPIPLDSIAQPSTQQHHLDQSSPVQSHHGGAVAGPGPSSQSKPRLIKHPSDIRPSHATQQAHDAERVRRISSPSIPSAPADLPQIRNLLPRTTVPGLTASGMTQGDPAGTLAMRGGADLPDPPISPKSYYPTSVQGVSERDEDEGHSWVGPQTDKEKVWWNVQKEDEVTKRPGETERQRSKRELVAKLRRLMTCNLCPPGTHRTFHHPLTLPCGHTLSSDHLSIPCPAPLALPASTPPHELYAAEQKQHAQRLALWAGVMCPIPTCKRYSPYAVSGVSHEPNSPTTAFRSMSAPAVIAPTVMSSGVPVYPSQAPAPPYSADPVFHEVGSPLLDTAVDKVLGLVLLATGEEGEAYSRTFDKDKTKGKESDMSADKSTVKGRDREGEMDVDVVGAQTGHARGATGITDEMDDVRMSSSLGQSGGPHAAGTSSDRASGHAPSGPISIPMTMGEASTSVNEPNSPVSSTTRSPSLKRPRNRLGTGSVDSGASDDITLDTAAETSDQSLEEYIRHAVDTGRATNANEARAQYNARPGVADRTEAQSKSGPIDGSDDVTSALRSDDPVSSASGDEPRSGSHHERDGEASSLVGSTSKPPVFSLGKSDHADADSFKVDLQGVLECDVCAQLLFEPVTTPCQHSFCSKCLARSLDHSQRCPVCRQNLPSFAFFNENTVNRVLLTILKTAFPTEYAERAAAIEKDERDARLNTPIFVCTLAFPGMPTILHVFEPRYRLMIRRCIESDTPRFGMVLPSRASRAGANGNAGAGMFPMAIAPPNAAAGAGLPGPAGAAGDVGAGAAANAEAAIAGGELGGIGGVMEYGTMLEIQSVQMLPDGRSMVETVGTHRFRLLEKGSLDGYTIGRVERIDDIPPEEEAALEAQAVRAAKAAKDARAAHSRSLFGHRTTGNAGVSMTSVPGAQPVSMPSSSSGPAMHPNPPQASPSQPGMPPHAPLPIDDTPQSTAELMNICRSFIDQLRSGSAPWLLQRLNNTYGSMPTDPSEFSYWMALVMPIDEFEKARLLPIRSPRLRLKLIVHWVESLRSSWWFSSG